MERKLASREDERVLPCFGLVERIVEQHMVNRVMSPVGSKQRAVAWLTKIWMSESCAGSLERCRNVCESYLIACTG